MEDLVVRELSLLRAFVQEYRKDKELDFERIFALSEGGERAENWRQKKRGTERRLQSLNLEIELVRRRHEV
jgi:hypothetical protein